MSFTWLRTGKSKIIPKTCRFCSISHICFPSHPCLKTFWYLPSVPRILLRAGFIHGTFMQTFLWTGGRIILFNPLKMQFSIISIRYAPHVLSTQCSRLYLINRTLYIIRNSATQNHPTSRNTCMSIIYPSPAFCRLYTSGRFPSTSSVPYMLNNFRDFWP